MKIYGLAMKASEGGGHGDPGGSFLAIRPVGPYGSGEYPPLFTTRENAEAYLTALEKWHGLQIIELELSDAPRL